MDEFDRIALQTLARDYMELTHELKTLEDKQTTMRETIAETLHIAGLRSHTVPGVAMFTMEAEKERLAYDSKLLDAFMQELIDQNTDFTDAVVRRLQQCQRTVTTKAHLRVAKARG